MLVGAGLAVAVGLAAVVALALAWGRGGGGEAVAASAPAIDARADLSPRIVLFGDTVTAFVEVTLDRNRVDPDSVRLRVAFAPWKAVASPKRDRRDGDATTYLRTTYVLRCVASSCTSTRETDVRFFEQAQVAYTAVDAAGNTSQRLLRVPWPQLVVGSRFSSDAQGSTGSRWRADLVSLPAVGYGIGPGLLFAVLLAGAASFAIAGVAFAYVALPRRGALDSTAVEPAPPVLTPLERALALLEDPVRVDGSADQRRALELVARGLVERGDTTLADTARTLAWSRRVPGVEETQQLAAQTRSSLAEAPA
jgi:hypothetical protein